MMISVGEFATFDEPDVRGTFMARNNLDSLDGSPQVSSLETYRVTLFDFDFHSLLPLPYIYSIARIRGRFKEKAEDSQRKIQYGCEV